MQLAKNPFTENIECVEVRLLAGSATSVGNTLAACTHATLLASSPISAPPPSPYYPIMAKHLQSKPSLD